MNFDYNDIKGRIFNIQKFSVHDGPGIRTIVFFKGCPLKCRWCCNPESQIFDPQEMIENGKKKIMGRDVTVGEVMKEVVQDMPYYLRSGGGMTLSGGECLLQPEFAVGLLNACYDLGINTAIESTGFAKYDTIKKLLPYLDVYLMDIKHIDSKKHKEFTTQPNELILENAKKIAKDANKLIIRVPVIPTFNDTKEEIGQIADFVKNNLENVNEMHLLPYHRLGSEKYENLGRNYALKEILPPLDEHMQMLCDIVTSKGLKCQIGG